MPISLLLNFIALHVYSLSFSGHALLEPGRFRFSLLREFVRKRNAVRV